MMERRDGAAARAWFRRKDRPLRLWTCEAKQAGLVAGRLLEHYMWSYLNTRLTGEFETCRYLP